MTWFDSTVLYATTSTSMADRLSYKQEVGGSNPPSSTVAEVEVDDTPGCGPGGSRFESGRSPHRTAGDLGSARSHTPCTRVRFPLPRLMGLWRNLEAQLPCKEKVVGSSPTWST